MDQGRAGSDRPAHPWEAVYPPGVSWQIAIPERPLFALLDEAAARYPDHRFLDFLGKSYTYRAVAGLVDRVACGLQALGVGKGSRVGLLLPNCPYHVIGFFAILKAGGTVVNINPLSAAPEVMRQIRESGARIVLTLDLAALYPKLAPSLGGTPLETIVVCRMADILPFPKSLLFPLLRRRDRAAIPDDAAHLPFRRLIANDGRYRPPAIDPRRDVAALQFTGGTTGVPKGASLTHYNLQANVAQVTVWFTQAEPGRERLLAVLPFFHAFGMTGVMNFAVALGGELILLPRFELGQLLATIDRTRPTVFCGVPALFRALADAPGLARHDLSSLKVCISGGDSLPRDVEERFAAATGCRLAEGYGLTECAPVVTCSNPPEGIARPGSAGVPLPGTVVEIVSLDDRRTLLPPGEKGEICVSGPQVMAGYAGQPAATAEVLAEGRLRTGDVGYLDAEGYLYVVDRLKEVIITSGFNVYPQLVEEAIRQHPAVAEVGVAGLPDRRRGQIVAAFVVPRPGHELDRAALERFLADRLSPVEMPRRIFFRASLPRSALGKVLRKELLSEALADQPARPAAAGSG